MLLTPKSDGIVRGIALAGMFGFAACSADPATTATSRGAGRQPPVSNVAGSGAIGAIPPAATAGAVAPGPNIATQAPSSGSNPNAPKNVNANGEGTCEVVQLVAQPVIPEMLIVLDRSGSMREKRWVPSVSAVRSLTTELQSKIHFGLAMFPDPAAGNAGAAGNLGDCLFAPDVQACIDMITQQVNSAPCAAGKIVVPVAPDNGAAIAKVLGMTQPNGGTPTAETLARVVAEYATAPAGPDDMTRAKYVLLVTDGAPTCPAGNGMQTLQPDIDASNAAIEQLAAKNVKTYVIGYDTRGPENVMFASVLDGFAMRGGTGDKAHRPVEDEISLVNEFTRITASIASCRFELSAPPQRPDYVLVRIDGKQINLNDPNGFVIIGDRSVELQGAACTTFKQGQHLLDAQVQCSVVQPG